MLYALLIKSRFIPRWLSVLGLFGAFLSAVASVLVLFQVLEIITTEYIILNIPAAISELIMGIWLMVKGFGNSVLKTDK